MDFSLLIVAIVGAVGGGVVTGVGAMFRSRTSVKSAARLIHAELTDNTASVRYFRTLGSWPPLAEVRHTAWDTYGVTLSRMRRPEGFHAIQKGYSALEGIAFISRTQGSSETLPSDVMQEILDLSIGEVRDALEKAGTLAGLSLGSLRAQLDAMEAQAPRGGDGLARLAEISSGAIPASTLDAIVSSGTAFQSAAAAKTLEKMESRLAPSTAAAHRKPKRTVYDAQGKSNYDGTFPVVRAEGDPPTGDPAVDDAYDGLGAFYTFFSEVFDRDSVDGKGQSLEAVVHWGTDYSNTYWDGVRLVSGDGDGQLLTRFTGAVDMVASQLTYGVIAAEVNLNPWQQSGALSVSLANVFGVLVKQYQLQQTVEQADWLVGAGVLGPGVKGVALQSLAAPGTAFDDPVLGKDTQPAHMRDYFKPDLETDLDYGGVHTNSGIPNHAFYTTASALGGYSWERAGHIWYEAMRDPRLKPTARFATFARATHRAASRLYGEKSDEVDAVEAGWEKVGVSP